MRGIRYYPTKGNAEFLISARAIWFCLSLASTYGENCVHIRITPIAGTSIQCHVLSAPFSLQLLRYEIESLRCTMHAHSSDARQTVIFATSDGIGGNSTIGSIGNIFESPTEILRENRRSFQPIVIRVCGRFAEHYGAFDTSKIHSIDPGPRDCTPKLGQYR